MRGTSAMSLCCANRNDRFINRDTMSSLQIFEDEGHPNIHMQGKGGRKKEGLSLFGKISPQVMRNMLLSHCDRYPQFNQNKNWRILAQTMVLAPQYIITNPPQAPYCYLLLSSPPE